MLRITVTTDMCDIPSSSNNSVWKSRPIWIQLTLKNLEMFFTGMGSSRRGAYPAATAVCYLTPLARSPMASEIDFGRVESAKSLIRRAS